MNRKNNFNYQYSDTQILDKLKDYLPLYLTLLESEKIAIDILSKYKIRSYTTEYNRFIKKEMEEYLKIAKIRNLTIPSKWYEYLVTTKDIIERIDEFAHEKARWFNDLNYPYDDFYGYFDDDIEVEYLSQDELSSYIKAKETINSYKEIIKKEFGEKAFNDFYDEEKQIKHLIKTLSKDCLS